MSETYQQRYIRILAQISKPPYDPRGIGGEDGDACVELLDAGFITGTKMKAFEDLHYSFYPLSITISGREYLDKLKDDIYQASIIGKIKKYLGNALGIICGVLLTLFVQYISDKFLFAKDNNNPSPPTSINLNDTNKTSNTECELLPVNEKTEGAL